ncbi:MAG: hypothetical protein WAW75_10240, partial [Gallionella sp.]
MTSNLMLASPFQDRLVLWRRGLNDLANTAIVERLKIEKFEALADEVVQIKPQGLLLDFDLFVLNGSNG